jgi:starch synthase (maltosyl-transferring)
LAAGSTVVVESIEPVVEAGRYPAKSIVGDTAVVSADVFSHGHDLVRAWLRRRHTTERVWADVVMVPLGNDRFAASFTPELEGVYEVQVVGARDHFASWRRDARRRLEGERPDPNDAAVGSHLLRDAAAELTRAARGAKKKKAPPDDPRAVAAAHLLELAEQVAGGVDIDILDTIDSQSSLFDLIPPPDAKEPAGSSASASTRIEAERPKAAFSSWYEMFPRSASDDPNRSGTFTDVIKRLPYVAGLGFDVLYLPPIHPIGTTARKGKGNSTVSEAGDVGSPWAIGSPEGGHTSIAAELGTFEDFDDLLAAAGEHGIELALDLAFQCSPDHPWVKDHPEWFRHRPDGTIACAENPPKRYEDIYPLDFDSVDAAGLWEALRDVTLFWAERGVSIFRVDNPHTKPFAFWEWMIREVKAAYPQVLFLSEAFTRPKVMHRLAKLGFDQSYTYFTWRDSKWELIQYFDELAHGPASTFFRPNVWPNTPDILAHSLAGRGHAAFMSRLVLAAGMSSNYGIYGPVFELMWNQPAATGSEEYFASEKYQVHHHHLDDDRSIAWFVARVNAARHQHPALQRNDSLTFHHVDNDQIICWSKRDHGSGDTIIGVVNIDPEWAQGGFTDLNIDELGIAEGQRYAVRDLLDGSRYVWSGRRNFVRLDPGGIPAHLLAVEHV